MASQFKTFASGDVLTASEVNTYLMKQAVIVCDTSADYPASPAEGMVVYDKALDSHLGYSGSAWVRLTALTSTAVQTWTPTVTQGVSVAATSTTAKYMRQGSIVTCWCNLAITASGTSGSTITVTLPVSGSSSVHAVTDPIGSGIVYDTGTANYLGSVQFSGSLSSVIFAPTGTSGNTIGSGPSMQLTSGDFIRFTATYAV